MIISIAMTISVIFENDFTWVDRKNIGPRTYPWDAPNSSSSLTMAILKAQGTEPMESDLFIISKIGLVKIGNNSLKVFRQCRSNMQVVGLKAVTRLVKALGEIISNCEREELVKVPAFIKVLKSA